MTTIDLNGAWQFRAVDPEGTMVRDKPSLRSWMPATVPGTVHTDLMANGVIPDPFYRMQENEVQWVDLLRWTYRREVRIPAEFLRADAVELVAEGLDTYAEIFCNGKRVGESADMFVGHRFNVKKLLRAGTNMLEVRFDSPTHRPKALEAKEGRLEVALESHRVYARKAQYSYGWDWGPKLTTSGIWRAISLESYSRGRLRDPFVKVLSLNSQEAVVALTVDVERFGRRALTVRTVLEGGKSPQERNVTVRSAAIRLTMRIPRPRLWWPNGYGEQPLYTAKFALLDDGVPVHQVETNFALRTVRLLQEKDEEGRSFVFEVNGKKIFCKGADWIPCDAFLPRVPVTTCERLLRMAKDAHMNMIRVWGGGIYEQEAFYDVCDRLGLMVWQDFMFACAEYPERPWFLKLVTDEAAKVLRRLRNHPSIVLWCGNNECEWIYCTEHPGATPDDMRGAKIFRDVLPALTKQLDGTRPYWRSSPFGRGFPNDESNGNHHQWIVWSFWKDYRRYEEDRARFVTEFGFQAPASCRTFEGVTLPEDRRPQSAVMEHHNKQVEGTERLLRFQAGHFRLDGGFESFIYNGQILQAEALKCAVEHWRRRKFRTGGALFWQLNDCWPVSSWSVIDSDLRPKAAYFSAARFMAPVLVSFARDGNALAVWLTSDRWTSFDARLQLSLHSFQGATVWKREREVHAAPNASLLLTRLEPSLDPGRDAAAHYLRARIVEGSRIAAENRFLFAEPKHLLLPDPGVKTKIEPLGDGVFELRIRPARFVKGLRVEFRGEDIDLEDNFLDIDAGEERRIRFRSALSKRQLKRKLRLRWVTE